MSNHDSKVGGAGGGSGGRSQSGLVEDTDHETAAAIEQAEAMLANATISTANEDEHDKASARAASYLELLNAELLLMQELDSVRSELENSRQIMRENEEIPPDSLNVLDDGPIASMLEFLDIPSLGRCEIVSVALKALAANVWANLEDLEVAAFSYDKIVENGNWRSDTGDLPKRREILLQTTRYLCNGGGSEWLDGDKKVAQIAEHILYQAAPSLETYSNSLDLMERLEVVLLNKSPGKPRFVQKSHAANARERTVRYYIASTFARRIEPYTSTHDMNAPCIGRAPYPSRIETEVLEHPENYEYFVRFSDIKAGIEAERNILGPAQIDYYLFVEGFAQAQKVEDDEETPYLMFDVGDWDFSNWPSMHGMIDIFEYREQLGYTNRTELRKIVDQTALTIVAVRKSDRSAHLLNGTCMCNSKRWIDLDDAIRVKTNGTLGERKEGVSLEMRRGRTATYMFWYYGERSGLKILVEVNYGQSDNSGSDNSDSDEWVEEEEEEEYGNEDDQDNGDY